MTEQELWQRFNDLPTDAQRQVADLISFLHARLGVERGAAQVEAEQGAFFGIWRGREDLTDSSAWVRGQREREWFTHR